MTTTKTNKTITNAKRLDDLNSKVDNLITIVNEILTVLKQQQQKENDKIREIKLTDLD